MGLKTTNYKVKTGDVLENAYAIFSDIKKIGQTFEATFSIYRERSAFNKTAPYEEKKVRFIWDRKSDLVKTAYEKSKEPIKVERFDQEKNENITVVVNGIFTGWEDDISE